MNNWRHTFIQARSAGVRRKLGEISFDDEHEDADSSVEHSGTAASEQPQFDHPDREGAAALKKAGYVEQQEFEQPMLAMLKAGKTPSCYACATCEYYQHDESKLKGGWCTKFKAEDAPHGCCNSWEFNESGKIKEVKQ